MSDIGPGPKGWPLMVIIAVVVVLTGIHLASRIAS